MKTTNILLFALLLLLSFAHADFNPNTPVTYVTFTLSDGQVLSFHDFTYWCTYTPNCTLKDWKAVYSQYKIEMEASIQQETVIQADTIISHNYLYASAGVYVSDYPTALQQLLAIKTLPNGEIDKATYPPFLIQQVGSTLTLNSGKTTDFLLHLLARNYKQQDMILKDTCKLSQASRLSWCGGLTQ